MKRCLAAWLVLLLPACAGLGGKTPAGDGGAAGMDGGGTGQDGAPVCSEGAVPDGEPPGPSGPRVVIDATTTRFEVSPVMLGANVNKWYDDAQGLWDGAAGVPVADAVEKTARAGVGLLRHPGGTSANLFDWKRAVGPRAARRCQTDGLTLAGRPDTSYGPSEFMQLVRAAGADAQIMVPFASESAADAADWVEYMNAPVGTNPNGGTAWAEVRQADGSPEPYGVTRWEIGNEQDRGGHQRYWMSKDDLMRMDQYIEGAVIQFTDQPAGRACDFRRTTTTAAAGQRFHLLYGLIKPGTDPVVKVGGAVWTPVADLSAAGPADQVYALDRGDASFIFGDGINGVIPPAGQQVTVSYAFEHRGFVAVYEAMKATAAEIGMEIDVCATWAPPAPRGTDRATLGSPSFPAAMASRGLADRYDCVAMHPYTNFGRDFADAWDDAAEGHQEHMLGDEWSRIMVDDLTEEVRVRSIAGADGRPAFVTISELGALWFGEGAVDAASKAAFPAFSATMTHALFMASQWIHFAQLGVRWVEGNTLVADRDGIRGVLGGSATGFVYGAEAMTREALRPVFADGARWTASRVEDQEVVTVGAEGEWRVLVVGATTGADGALRIVVVNRQMSQAQVARVVPEGFLHGATVEVTQVRGDSFQSYNDGEPGGGDESVEITTDTITVDAASFDHSFPPASVTVLTLRPPC